MHHFDRIDGALQAEGVPLEALADAVGTPAYVYSSATLTRHYGLLAEAVAAHPSALGEALIAFAVKANSNLSVLATLARLGCGADTVSEGEIRRALKAGIPANRIVFSGVGKSDAELAFAIEAGVRQINVESAVELDRLIAVASSKDARPEIAIRVNPAVGAGGHARITTGGATDKFGVPADEAHALYARASLSPHVTPVGLACHIGSQITTLEPLESAFRALRTMTLELRAAGLSVTRLDLGGGLGVPYHGQSDLPSIEAYVAMAARVLDGLEVEAAFEPGRLLAANAGVLLSRVIQVNERGDGRRFLVLDAGMNDLMRPALYDAFHDLVPVRPRQGEARLYDLVGPICESTDVFARDRRLPPMQAGDLVAFMGAGAYGAVLASEYNSRPLVPEVLVDGERWAVVRKRPSYDEMWEREPRADWL
ncbi:MAG: diaminopimelate decarboxylase [Alphaproteobacteria bacterium]|nr:diaminopimelate decarboxylase [Alphaproteobacteria bacterium]MBU2042084.1 diaminopimelate decarboxylase [Alphaproteobacteria bacterium]MBU2149734.1 diaminopimelate decarboxylase [Alphaproteobacteria bacterium]MBU2209578.1 diaminopimelate decarboxylase [Alphaproteobacteria bacterium]MBU2292400.1 diaminopimelate decarboxylase [Alphaproteobacteria bacterium]